jgi:hypothetical protein|tara:strand:+ start:654 stop:992 length:339 start_codon:yes stop_codon:yes gene_type:complete
MSPITSQQGVGNPFIQGTVLGGEQLTLSVTSGTLAGQHSATVPSGTTRIVCFGPSAVVYFAKNKTATSTNGYAVVSNGTKAFVIEHADIPLVEVVAGSSTPTLEVLYLGTPS